MANSARLGLTASLCQDLLPGGWYLLTRLNLFWRRLMWFLRPLGLIMFRQSAIIAVITRSVHHTFALTI